MSKSFKIITLGCKVNQYESAFLMEALAGAGCQEVSGNEKADIIIINTCIVTQRASYQSRQAIRKAIRENPGAITAAVGCYAQVFPDELSGIEGLQLIAGNTAKGKLPDILLQGFHENPPRIISRDFQPDTGFECLSVQRFLNRTRAFLKIQDGCQSFCSYCVVPFARGPLRSLDPSRVISMIRSYADEGYKEVVLTGIHLGRYGIDLSNGTDLKGLLGLIGREAHSVRIRLSSIEPNEMDQALLEMVADEPWFCRHFHMPLQSGDSRILKAMNRNYTPREYRDLIERIHKRIPLVAIGSDVMTGFPGEDDHAYQNTLSLIRDLPVSYLHVFPFSPRRGTPAASFSGQVDPKVIKERVERLRTIGQEKRDTFYHSCIGKLFWVIAEGREADGARMIKGLSDNYLRVLFPSETLVPGKMVRVSMVKVMKKGVLGREVSWVDSPN